MDLQNELQPRGLAINILENPAINNAVSGLTQKAFDVTVWRNLAVVSGLPNPETITTLDTFVTESRKQQINPVSGLFFERYGRRTIIDQIASDVIYSDADFAVFETDMDNLKGLNDKYGENEADKGIRRFAEWVEQTIVEAIESGGQEIKYALLNQSGEGSDSIKVILIGKNIYNFCRSYFDQISVESTSIMLTSQSEQKKEKISGGWGFYVFENSPARQIDQVINGSLDVIDKAGEIYNSASSLASERMTADKVRTEAELVNRIFNAQTLNDLEDLETEIVSFGERIPKIILTYFNRKRKELTK